MSTSVYALALTDHHANDLIAALRHADVPVGDISVLLSDSITHEAREKSTTTPDGAVTGGSTGSSLGGALGWMARIGLISIPGLGLFVAAGPILELLSGGAVAGGLAGMLTGLGIPDYESKQYARTMSEGQVLVCVHTHSRTATQTAKRLLNDRGGMHIGASCDHDDHCRTPPLMHDGMQVVAQDAP